MRLRFAEAERYRLRFRLIALTLRARLRFAEAERYCLRFRAIALTLRALALRAPKARRLGPGAPVFTVRLRVTSLVIGLSAPDRVIFRRRYPQIAESTPDWLGWIV